MNPMANGNRFFVDVQTEVMHDFYSWVFGLFH